MYATLGDKSELPWGKNVFNTPIFVFHVENKCSNFNSIVQIHGKKISLLLHLLCMTLTQKVDIFIYQDRLVSLVPILFIVLLPQRRQMPGWLIPGELCLY